MQRLKELPPGTIWPHLIEAIQHDAAAEIESYAASRRNDVARRAETAELAAVMVDKYASGMAKALQIVGVDADVQVIADRLVREIDPEFEVHQRVRWAARPATIPMSTAIS